MTAPAPTPPPQLGPPGERCRSCGAPLAEDQRYCLNCGTRRAEPRVAYDVLLRSAAQPQTATPGARPGEVPPSLAAGPRTVSPLGAAAGLGLLLFAVLVGATLGDRGDQPVAPQSVVTLPASTTPGTAAATAFVSDWTGGDGWTVQLQVLPKTGATPEQVLAAKQAATAAGAVDVGALDSSAYPSLPADEYVIYSGRFEDKKAAKAALKDLETAFPDAQVVEVSTTPADAADAADAAPDAETKTSDSELEALENASPEEFVKKSRKLPDEVVTEGEPPPVDNAAPGGGSDEAAEIG